MQEDDSLRSLWRAQSVEAPRPASIDALRERGRRMARKRSRRAWTETIAGSVSMVLLGALGLHMTGAPLVQLACVLLVLGELVVIATMWRRGTPRAEPLDASTSTYLAHYRGELAKERDYLASSWRGYLAPTVPGLVLFPIALSARLGMGVPFVAGVSVASIALVGAIVVVAHRRTARRLSRELEALAE